jgi:hypothetical protein
MRSDRAFQQLTSRPLDTVTFSPDIFNPRSNSYRGLMLGNEQNRHDIWIHCRRTDVG